MAKFLTGDELNSEIGKLFERADEQLILISPYIKLHDRYASALRTKMREHRLKIFVIFGKNESELSRSMKQEDFNFFKEFPNLEIRYERRLHAKYYANETSAILTSMNLYDFSQNNNIEAGVLTKATLFGNIANNFVMNMTGEDSFDQTAATYFNRVIEQSVLLYKKVPVYESTMLGLTKKYKVSRIEKDELSDFFAGKYGSEKIIKINKQAIKNFESKDTSSPSLGYCIRTGKQIEFNPSLPFSPEAFQSWSKFKNDEYPEKYCHFTGEYSDGKTSKSRPILQKNWKTAKATFKW